MATTTSERDYSHRSTVQKLGVKPDQRLEVSGDVGAPLRPRNRRTIVQGVGDVRAEVRSFALSLPEANRPEKTRKGNLLAKLSEVYEVLRAAKMSKLEASFPRMNGVVTIA